jgi:hypothetical protein
MLTVSSQFIGVTKHFANCLRHVAAPTDGLQKVVVVMMMMMIQFYWKCYVGPCHHGMGRPRVADGGDGLQIWRVAVNVLNKQLRQPLRGGLQACVWAKGYQFLTVK